MIEMREAIIPTTAYGMRVDSALAELLPEYSRSQITRWLKSGFITLNQRTYLPKEKVYGNERVYLNVIQTAQEIEPEDIALNILFEDEHCLIVNKPQGLIVHPGAGNPNHTLLNALLYHDNNLAQLPRAGIVHRLDQNTTGLLIVAKSLPAYTSLVQQMQRREISRHYQALVHGRVVTSATINTYFGRHPHNRLKMAVCKNGKQAITHYAPLQLFKHFTLLEVTLETGRTHQIRVHMQHLKHAVVGDPIYGQHYTASVAPSIKDYLQTYNRQALHAYKLILEHPITKAEIAIEAPLPEDLQKLLHIIAGDD